MHYFAKNELIKTQFINSKKFVIKNSLIESHKNFLKQVGDETLLYKVVSFENFLKMLYENYLYFNKVDNYADDKNDSAQPEREKLMNQQLYFEKDPNFTLRNYYDGKDLLCLHLDDQGNIIKEYRADNIVQIFHLNYGVVNYGDFANDIMEWVK